MPIRESYCQDKSCDWYGFRQERFYHTSEKGTHPCQECGGATILIEFSSFAIVFTGPITARYNDRNKDGAHQEGHWQMRRKTASGIPEPVFISDFQQQREFCKSEGLINPKDVGNNVEVAADGKKLLNVCGTPGSGI